MQNAIKQNVIVQSDGSIKLHSPEFKPGMKAEVFIILKDAKDLKIQTLSSIIGKGKGCFDTPSDADAFIRSERDKWE